jgi:UbiD family decarboxylase
MPDLKSYIDSLPENEKLVISEPVDLDFCPTSLVLELEGQKRFPVVVIERSKGFDVPVVTNLFADRDRIARMVGASPGGFGQAWARALANLAPAVMTDQAPVHEVVTLGNEVDAGQLPISRHFEADAGRYIGSGILICKDPDTGVRNLSFQRMQLKGPNRFGASLHSRGHIWDHLLRCEARGKNMEVAVVIGCHPAIYIAAAAKVAMETDELEVAGALMREPVKLVKCKTIDIEVPADAEYVIEGEILAGVHEDEGPYGEYTGYSTYRSTRNVFVVKAITHKHKPIFLDVIPGYSAEHLLLSRCTREAHVTHRLREMVPTLKAVSYPKTGVHFHAYMSLKKTAEGQARQALMLLMGLDSYIKLAVAVDDDIDVFNEDEVLWALATRFQADTDMFVVPEVFCNRLDPSSVDGMSAKIGIDATKAPNFEGERTRQTPQSVAWARSVISRQSR